MIEVPSMNRSVDCWLRRHKMGIKVKVRVKPEIEEFFRQWGGGVEIPPTHGRLWRALDDKPITLWSFEEPLKDGRYDLVSAGASLLNSYEGTPNLSFLRIVGASGPEGREFIVESVASTEEIERISNKIGRAGDQFYLDYIRPVNINIYVGTMDASRHPELGQ